MNSLKNPDLSSIQKISLKLLFFSEKNAKKNHSSPSILIKIQTLPKTLNNNLLIQEKIH
jgi:hypothetical protein